MQRVRDSWRSVIGSTAVTVVLAFFTLNQEFDFSTDEDRKVYADWALPGLAFIYEDTSDEKESDIKYVDHY